MAAKGIIRGCGPSLVESYPGFPNERGTAHPAHCVAPGGHGHGCSHVGRRARPPGRAAGPRPRSEQWQPRVGRGGLRNATAIPSCDHILPPSGGILDGAFPSPGRRTASDRLPGTCPFLFSLWHPKPFLFSPLRKEKWVWPPRGSATFRPGRSGSVGPKRSVLRR